MTGSAILTAATAQEIMSSIGVRCTPRVTIVNTNNHVYRIHTPEGDFHLKTYTKGWYSPEPAETRGCVMHEASAYRIVSAHGIPAPRVRLADETCDNPIRRPFLLMETLPGRPATKALQAASSRDGFEAVLRAVGRYMARMHAITFRFPGYLMTEDGPTAAPDPDAWQHFIFTIYTFRKDAFKTWETDREIAGGLLERVKQLYAHTEDSLRSEYEPPRFTHGDCHAHQFFVSDASGEWEVVGVVDMEVASAGDYGFDFVKLGLELAGMFPTGRDWWTPLFDGYGKEPPFEPMRLRFAACAYDAEYLGPHNWPGQRALRLAHILDARDWASMFDLSDLIEKSR